MVGIYQIQSKLYPDKIYIGSSIDIEHRWMVHLCYLRNNKHKNKILQNHCNKYGESDLQFSVLIECSISEILKLEQYIIDIYNPYFNILKIAGSNLGFRFKQSDEAIEKWKISNKDKKRTKKTHWKLSDETKQKMSTAKIGVPKSEEHKNNISKARKGKHYKINIY